MIDNVAGLLKVPGINPQIIGASIATFQRAFCSSVRYVWITAVAFAVLGLCGEPEHLFPVYPYFMNVCVCLTNSIVHSFVLHHQSHRRFQSGDRCTR